MPGPPLSASRIRIETIDHRLVPAPQSSCNSRGLMPTDAPECRRRCNECRAPAGPCRGRTLGYADGLPHVDDEVVAVTQFRQTHKKTDGAYGDLTVRKDHPAVRGFSSLETKSSSVPSRPRRRRRFADDRRPRGLVIDDGRMSVPTSAGELILPPTDPSRSMPSCPLFLTL